MRLSRYFITLFLTTSLALVFVHQHFLLTRANYAIGNYNNQVSHLLDRNIKLMYNITSLESPANLEAKLSAAGLDYSVPKRWALVKRSKIERPYEFTKVAERRNVVLGSIVDFLATKAEARPLEN